MKIDRSDVSLASCLGFLFAAWIPFGLGIAIACDNWPTAVGWTNIGLAELLALFFGVGGVAALKMDRDDYGA